MSRASPFRRVVTGIGEDGKSRIIIDGPIERAEVASSYVWRSAIPADNSGSKDEAVPFTIDMVHYQGSNFMLIEFPPGMEPYMHATDTLDYFVMLKGEVEFATETGAVRLKPGDFVVNRGTQHTWRNDTDEVAVLAAMTVPSQPLGKGRTI
jgi:quercetin dioxygenase-like cupin family protein